nr:MAG TPA: hypothetical protein [Caudoviricetes sp.]
MSFVPVQRQTFRPSTRQVGLSSPSRKRPRTTTAPSPSFSAVPAHAFRVE